MIDLNKKTICQSCAMPMKTESDFGSNEDGGSNKEYCCYCFQNGKFVDEGITLKEKIEKLVEIGKNNLSMTEEQARAMAENSLPRLKRWKKEE